MMPQERLESLQRKHSMLGALIEREENQASSNEDYIRKLKRQKLMIKDILEGVRDDLVDVRATHKQGGNA